MSCSLAKQRTAVWLHLFPCVINNYLKCGFYWFLFSLKAIQITGYPDNRSLDNWSSTVLQWCGVVDTATLAVWIWLTQYLANYLLTLFNIMLTINAVLKLHTTCVLRVLNYDCSIIIRICKLHFISKIFKSTMLILLHIIEWTHFIHTVFPLCHLYLPLYFKTDLDLTYCAYIPLSNWSIYIHCIVSEIIQKVN